MSNCSAMIQRLGGVPLLSYLLLIVILLRLAVIPSPAATADYDVVIVKGRVIDPESNLDAVRNIGIGGGRIQAITPEPVRGQTTIDASGLVVSPGFIDLHEHAHEQENYRFQVMDGVTTSLGCVPPN